MIDDFFDGDKFSSEELNYICATSFVTSYGGPIIITLASGHSIFEIVQKVPIATSVGILGCVAYDVFRKKLVNGFVGIEDYVLSLATITATSQAVDYVHDLSKLL